MGWYSEETGPFPGAETRWGEVKVGRKGGISFLKGWRWERERGRRVGMIYRGVSIEEAREVVGEGKSMHRVPDEISYKEYYGLVYVARSWGAVA